MIRFLIKKYSKIEILHLRSAIMAAERYIKSLNSCDITYPNKFDCQKCKYYRTCKDLRNGHDYLLETLSK